MRRSLSRRWDRVIAANASLAVRAIMPLEGSFHSGLRRPVGVGQRCFLKRGRAHNTEPRAGRPIGHVINAVSHKGTIRFLDGQSGGAASFEGYRTAQSSSCSSIKVPIVDENEARRIAQAFLHVQVSPTVAEDVVLHEYLEETPEKWLFFYDTRATIEDGDLTHSLAGNLPVGVDKATGEANFVAL